MIPCSSCARFIRTNTTACPFCNYVIVPSTGPTIAGALILGLTLAACGGQSGDDGAGESSSGEMFVAAYGGPDVDSSFDTGELPDDPSSSDTGTSGEQSTGSSGTDATDGTTMAMDSTGTGTGTGSTSAQGSGSSAGA